MRLVCVKDKGALMGGVSIKAFFCGRETCSNAYSRVLCLRRFNEKMNASVAGWVGACIRIIIPVPRMTGVSY